MRKVESCSLEGKAGLTPQCYKVNLISQSPTYDWIYFHLLKHLLETFDWFKLSLKQIIEFFSHSNRITLNNQHDLCVINISSWYLRDLDMLVHYHHLQCSSKHRHLFLQVYMRGNLSGDAQVNTCTCLQNAHTLPVYHTLPNTPGLF